MSLYILFFIVKWWSCVLRKSHIKLFSIEKYNGPFNKTLLRATSESQRNQRMSLYVSQEKNVRVLRKRVQPFVTRWKRVSDFQ